MVEKKDQRGANPPKPESASKPAKRAYEQRGRPGHAGQSHQDNARGKGNPSSFPEGSEQASEAGRKSGRH